MPFSERVEEFFFPQWTLRVHVPKKVRAGRRLPPSFHAGYGHSLHSDNRGSYKTSEVFPLSPLHVSGTSPFLGRKRQAFLCSFPSNIRTNRMEDFFFFPLVMSDLLDSIFFRHRGDTLFLLPGLGMNFRSPGPPLRGEASPFFFFSPCEEKNDPPPPTSIRFSVRRKALTRFPGSPLAERRLFFPLHRHPSALPFSTHVSQLRLLFHLEPSRRPSPPEKLVGNVPFLSFQRLDSAGGGGHLTPFSCVRNPPSVALGIDLVSLSSPWTQRLQYSSVSFFLSPPTPAFPTSR